MNVDENDRQFLRSLAGSGPASVESLCERFGVTATAVRQRLSRLQAGELVERVAVRRGRGRPRFDYAVTLAGRRALGENYEELASVLWRGLSRTSDPAVRREVLSGVEDVLAERYGSAVDAVDSRDRFEQLAGTLRGFGFDVEVFDGPDGVGLREVSCPYHDIASHDRSLCEMERVVFERVLGVGVTLKNCCMDGEGSCEFVPTETLTAAPRKKHAEAGSH